MSQDEPQVPPKKKTKVEPLDRRGSLANFIKNRKVDIQDEGITPEKTPESPTQLLHRLRSDPAANHNNLCKTLLYFLPHVQLIEIESMIFEIVSKHKSIDNKTRLFELLKIAKQLSLLEDWQIGIGHDLRKIRNDLFHHNQLIKKFHIEKINDYWVELRQITCQGESPASRIKHVVKTNPDKIDEVQRVAEEICEVAILIDIEQILRKVLNWILKRDTVFASRFKQIQEQENLTNTHAIHAINNSHNRLSKSLKRLRFLNSIEKSIDYRNTIIHGQSDLNNCPKKSKHVHRSWLLLINLPYAFRTNCLILRLEELLRNFFISEGVDTEDSKKLSIEKLALKICNEDDYMTSLTAIGISRKDLLWLRDFSKEIFRYELAPPQKPEVGILTRLCNSLEKAPINSVFNLTHKPVIKSRESASKQAKQRFKHPKSRRFDDLDDFS